MSDKESNKIFKNAQTRVASSWSAIFCFRKITVSRSTSHTSFQPIVLCGQTDLYLFLSKKALGSHLHFLQLSLRDSAVCESSFNVHIPQYFPFHGVLEHVPPAASTSHNKPFSYNILKNIEEILTYTCSVFICSLSVVACYIFKGMTNVYKPTAVGIRPSPSPRTDRTNTPEDIRGDTDEPTRMLTYSCGRAGGARLHASPASPGLCGLMRCSVLKGSLDRYQIRSGKKGFAVRFWGFDRWSVAELFPVTVTPRAHCKDIKGPMGRGYRLLVR